MDPLAAIEALAEPRPAGSDAERRAAGQVAERLRELGREVAVEPIDVYPRWAMVHAIHALLAVAGSLVSVAQPIVGLALVALAALSAFGDAAGLLGPLRRLTGRRASQNVVSLGGEERAGQIVLLAHVDSARGGAIFSTGLQRRLAVLGARMRRPIGPFVVFMAALVALVLCCVVRVLGQEGDVLTAVQLIPTIVLIASVAVLIDVGVSETVPGANDNASGIAAVLRLAESLDGGLRYFGLGVVITGGQESFGLGMKAFLKRHKGDLHRESTVFVNVDEVGAGTVRYGQREGALLAGRTHPHLFEIAEQIAEDDVEDAFSARPLRMRTPTDASVARLAGYPAITVACRDALGLAPRHHQMSDTVDHIDSEALERAHGFTAELIRRVDAEAGPALARAPAVLAERGSDA